MEDKPKLSSDRLADVPKLKEPIAGDQFIKYDPVKDVSLFYRGHFGGKEQYFTVEGSYDRGALVRAWDEKEKKYVEVVPPQYKVVDRKGRFTFDRIFPKFESNPSQMHEQAAPEEPDNLVSHEHIVRKQLFKVKIQNKEILQRLDRIENGIDNTGKMLYEITVQNRTIIKLLEKLTKGIT